MVTIFDDWIHWLLSAPPEEIFWLHFPALLLDGPRYALGSLVVLMMDLWQRFTGRTGRNDFPADDGGRYTYAPPIAVVLAGLNEADSVAATLASLWGSYPNMEIFVVDDGSNDGMADRAREFARTHPGVKVFRRQQRGGKSSALNFALSMTEAEIVVNVDADSVLGPQAIWEILQPFQDPTVGAVGGVVMVRNATTNLCTWLQAIEYRTGIFLGRMFTDRFDMLGIVSGAFGAFRTSAMRQLHGWDVGPGEDGDLVLRLRRAGYRILFAPYAECYTNAPTKWKVLIKQRRRWEWAIVTFECRKHLALAYPWQAKFRWSNLALVVDRILYNVVLVYLFWIFAVWIALRPPIHLGMIALSNYVLYLIFGLIQTAVILYYTPYPMYDLKLALGTPLMPFYYLLQRGVTCWAITEEFLSRRSFRDNFVPVRVRTQTWHW